MSAVSQDARWQGTRACGCRGRKGRERARAVTGRGTPEKWTGAAKWGLVGSSSYADSDVDRSARMGSRGERTRSDERLKSVQPSSRAGSGWQRAAGSWLGQPRGKGEMARAIPVGAEMGGMVGSEIYLGGRIDKT